MTTTRVIGRPFQKGHPPFIGNGAVKIGRPKLYKTKVKDALRLAEDAMPAIILAMIERAKNPLDRDSQRAAEYLADRIYGRPNQPLSNKDGSKLTSFSFLLPAGFIPSPGGLIGNSDNREDSQKN